MAPPSVVNRTSKSSSPARYSAIGVALCLILLPSLVAQSSDDRAALEQLRDSLAAITDTVDLIHLEDQWIVVARVDRDNAMLHLRLGFLGLRLGELSGKSHFDDAGSEFEWAVQLQPSWPYGWYGLGLAEQGLARTAGNVLFGVFAWLDRDQRTLAVDAFSDATQRDPGFMPALSALSESTDDQEINQRPLLALDAFRRGSQTRAAEDPLFHLYLGRLERSYGSVDSSLLAFAAYRDLGGEAGMAFLEIARSRFLIPGLDGREPYYAGAAWDDSVTVAGYRADLSPIVSDTVLQGFDSASGAGRVDWLRTFWVSRDDVALQRRGARIREHYTRLATARRLFPRSPFMRRYGFGEYYRTNDTPFDDRGVIFVRHGAPALRRPLIVPNSSAYGAEGWRYEFEEARRDFYFLALEDPYDYRLRATPLDLPIAGRTDFLVEFEPRLSTAGSASFNRYAQEVFIQGKENIAVGTTTDSYTLTFENTLEALAQIVLAGGTTAGSVLHVAYAVPIADLQPVDSATHTYPIDVRVVVSTLEGTTLARYDSTKTWRIQAETMEGYLLDRVSLLVPPGPLEVHVAVLNGDAGGIFPRHTVEVLTGARPPVLMGEPVLGLRNDRTGWRLPQMADSVFFNPLATFPRESDLELYYELYGLQAGTEYATEIEVTKTGGGLVRSIFGGGGKKISLSFSQFGAGPVTPVRRTLSLRDLDRGTYQLTLSLEGPDGLSVEQTRQFEVTD